MVGGRRFQGVAEAPGVLHHPLLFFRSEGREALQIELLHRVAHLGGELLSARRKLDDPPPVILSAFAPQQEAPLLQVVQNDRGQLAHGVDPVGEFCRFRPLRVVAQILDDPEGVERSFVFTRLGRPETPALLVVYDHVTSTRPEYRKYFLLNTITRPEFRGKTIRVENALPGGKPGELFVTTLLPKADNVEVTTSGDGKAMEFFREKVEMPPRNRRLSRGWRTMVSPKTPAREDRFLHVMQIGEPTAAKYPVELFEDGSWLGVRTAGRIMTFAKSGKPGSAPVEFTVPAGEAHQVLLTDLLPGEYTVTRDGRPLCRVSVSKQAGTVEMAVEPGHYRVDH